MLLIFMLQMYNFYFILTNILTENLHGNLLFATRPNLYNLFEGMHIKKYTVSLLSTKNRQAFFEIIEI